MYSPDYRYDIMSRIAMINGNESIPQYKCEWYNSTDVEIATSPGKALIPRGNQPNEQNFMKPDQWRFEAMLLAKSKYSMVGEYEAVPYLSEIIPGGLDNGTQCLLYKQKCRADNRDTVYLAAQNISVARDEAVVVIALDHVATGRAARYSNIAIGSQVSEQTYRGVMTGDRNEKRPPIPPAPFLSAVKMIYDVPPDSIYDSSGIALVFVAERVYVDPSTTVGPTYNSVLPMQIFVVKRNGDHETS